MRGNVVIIAGLLLFTSLVSAAWAQSGDCEPTCGFNVDQVLLKHSSALMNIQKRASDLSQLCPDALCFENTPTEAFLLAAASTAASVGAHLRLKALPKNYVTTKLTLKNFEVATKVEQSLAFKKTLIADAWERIEYFDEEATKLTKWLREEPYIFARDYIQVFKGRETARFGNPVYAAGNPHGNLAAQRLLEMYGVNPKDYLDGNRDYDFNKIEKLLEEALARRIKYARSQIAVQKQIIRNVKASISELETIAQALEEFDYEQMRQIASHARVTKLLTAVRVLGILATAGTLIYSAYDAVAFKSNVTSAQLLLGRLRLKDAAPENVVLALKELIAATDSAEQAGELLEDISAGFTAAGCN